MIDWVGGVREATIGVDWSGETECGKLLVQSLINMRKVAR